MGEQSRLPHVLLAAYALACVACMVWPVYATYGARIEPRVLGLPFSFAWVIGLAALTFVVLCCFHLATAHSD